MSWLDNTKMEVRHKNLVTNNLVNLTDDLDPKDIYDQLIEGDVLTFQDKERINHERFIIDGDPGLGKSILRQSLIYDWGHETYKGHPHEMANIHKWCIICILVTSYIKTLQQKPSDAIYFLKT
ncbi:hypothetical protein CAPTEDRAFT_201250 [Capitella teleta]|uniref:Uncharacterized protein n=1 Tax=Capitella teleta TaxID=283909 RepID=R7UUG8_CAPTE|nr:hypothetical protein CAPTEDRAFT_201250 [Capitella teleta]|eukprot:ELU10273.1 hypothetical protein CAPTEDRAFT_201250 [Capitella teleta]